MSELSPVEIVHAWEALEENHAWKLLKEAAQEQLRMREGQILYEPLTADNIYDREKLRGEHNGIELILRMAESMYEEAQADVANQVKESSDDPQI
jgi:hypothetical protein